MIQRILAFAFVVVALTGCNWGHEPARFARVSISADLPELKSLHGAPSGYDAMDCYAISVTGENVPRTYGSKLGQVSTDCIPLGIVTPLMPLSKLLAGVEMDVPLGAARRFEVLGIAGTGVAGCGATELKGLFTDTVQPTIYSLGNSKRDLFLDTVVTIKNAYATTTAIDLAQKCIISGDTGTGPNGSTGQLRLAGGYDGYVTMNEAPCFADKISTTLPNMPSTDTVCGGLASRYLAPALLTSSNGVEFPAITGSARNYRLDLIYEVSAITTAQSTLTVNLDVRASAGTSTTGLCAMTNALPAGYYLNYYNAGQAIYSSGSLLHKSFDVQQSETYTIAGQEITMPLQQTGNSNINGKYLVLSLRLGDFLPTNGCGLIRLNKAEVSVK
jgi:hypothetical protein